MSKTAGLEVSDRVSAAIDGAPALLEQLAPHRDWLAAEILAITLELGDETDLGHSAVFEEVVMPEGKLRLGVRRA
jgi:hypothetical protein